MDDLRQIAEKTFKDSQSFNSTLHRVGKLSIRRRDDIGALIHNRSEYHCPFNGFSGNDDKSCLGLLNAETTSNIPHVAGVTGVPVERDHAYVVPPPTSEALQTDGDDHKPSTLELVVVAQPPTLEMGIHAHVFLGLFHRYKIEPYILRLIARNVDGFYEFPQSSEGPHLAHISYFLHVRNRFMLAWSYALENASTDAILIARPTGSDQLVQDVIAHKGLLGHPLSLALVCCAHLLDGIRIEIGPELATIADTEAQTGFNPFEGGSVDTRRFLGGQKPDADHLDVLSGMMSSTGVVLALHRKYLGFVRGLLERMTLSRLLADVWRDAISEGRWDEYENLCRRISEVSSVLMPECDMTTPYIALLKERADVQQRVVRRPLPQSRPSGRLNGVELTCVSSKTSWRSKSILPRSSSPKTREASPSPRNTTAHP